MSTTRTSDAERTAPVALQAFAPCLVFADRCEEAVSFYVSLIPNSRVVSMDRWGAGGPMPEGKIMHAIFELNGQEYRAFDGGSDFTPSEAFSFEAIVETQDELDALWDRLIADGGKPGPCGWCTDRFGISWQVVPASLGKMLGDPRSGNAQAAMEAMLKMGKLDIKTLEDAYRSR
jgi:predicted 3-demethylubiquinone-9 3-methyltransferase (glyoxalase superfamily)